MRYDTLKPGVSFVKPGREQQPGLWRRIYYLVDKDVDPGRS